MATRGFRTAVVILLGVFAVFLVIGAMLMARTMRAVVERVTPTPSEATLVIRPPVHSRGPSPCCSPTPTEGPSSGTVLTAKGAELRRGSGQGSTGGPETSCESFLTPGASGDCGAFPAWKPSHVAWVVESQPVEGLANAAWSVRILGETRSGWTEVLRARDPQARKWVEVKATTRFLIAEDQPVIVVSYHYLGSGTDLGVDLVNFGNDGVPVVTHLPDAIQGSARLSGGRIDLYGARYPNNEPTCCPPFFLQQTIAWTGDGFAVVAERVVDPSRVPASDL